MSDDGAYPPGCTQADHDRAYGDNDPEPYDGRDYGSCADCQTDLDAEEADDGLCDQCSFYRNPRRATADPVQKMMQSSAFVGTLEGKK